VRSAPGKIISTGSGGKIDYQGQQAQDEEARRAAAAKARIEAERRAKEEGFVTEESGSDSDGSDEEDEDEDEGSEESSSEEEAPRRLMMRPKFIRKSDRDEGGTAAAAAATAPEANDEEAEAARKLAAADAMVEEQIRKDLAARAAGKKHWEDSDSAEDGEGEVDDTDDLDPEAELAAWKLRELKRIRRDREAIEERERERAEVERRRNLTEEERRAEDDAHIAKQRDEKDSRGKMAYMQKYFHKGAFYQDQSKEAGLDKRDIMGTRFADDVQNRELLPKALQMRDMTKLGKKGATKYRDLKSEDTGQWGRLDNRRDQRSDYRDRDWRDAPRDGQSERNGANAIPLGDRRGPPPGAPDGPRNDRSRDNDRYRDRYSSRRDDERRSRSPRRNDRDDRERRRSRSRSPRRSGRDDYRDRKRESSRDGDRYDSDKRRRVDAR
jgi:microfibrillar-associated protein 1